MPIDTIIVDVPLGTAHSQFVRSWVLIVVTWSGPVAAGLAKTETDADVVAPGPAIPRTKGLGENVRFCARAVSGLPKAASAAKVNSSAKQLNLRKFFLQKWV